MNNQLMVMIVNDIRLQFRNGIYYAYGFVLIIYLGALMFAGAHIPSWALGLLINSDPSVLGFFFLGALMMLEKSEDTRSALAVTPLSASTYFWSKAITLTTIALFASVLFALVSKAEVNWPLFIASVTLTSLAFIGVGVPIALKFKTVTGYLIGASGILTPFILPMFLALYDPMGTWAMFIPTTAQFRLLLVALGTFEASPAQLALMLIITALSTAALVAWGIASLKKELGD